MQQGKVSQAEKAIKTLYGKERVVELVRDLSTSGQGSSEPEAGWFDLFSSRYFKGIARLAREYKPHIVLDLITYFLVCSWCSCKRRCSSLLVSTVSWDKRSCVLLYIGVP